jgi:MFS superfamily sulfate permease-like transporter
LSQTEPHRAPTLSEVVPGLVARYVPISRWLAAYPKAWLRPDLTAGVTSWGVMVPVALAYAGLAGVPPGSATMSATT